MGSKLFLRRFGVIGDIHCEFAWLDASMFWFKQQRCERKILAVGDIVDGKGDADACIQLLIRCSVDAVLGNHDRWALAGEMRHLLHATKQLAPLSRDYLINLPSFRLYESSQGRIMLCHGYGRDDEAQSRSDGIVAGRWPLEEVRSQLETLSVKFLLCGHTHRPEMFQDQGIQIINVGCLRPHRGPTAVIVDTEAKTVRFRRLDLGLEWLQFF